MIGRTAQSFVIASPPPCGFGRRALPMTRGPVLTEENPRQQRTQLWDQVEALPRIRPRALESKAFVPPRSGTWKSGEWTGLEAPVRIARRKCCSDHGLSRMHKELSDLSRNECIASFSLGVQQPPDRRRGPISRSPAAAPTADLIRVAREPDEARGSPRREAYCLYV